MGARDGAEEITARGRLETVSLDRSSIADTEPLLTVANVAIRVESPSSWRGSGQDNLAV